MHLEVSVAVGTLISVVGIAALVRDWWLHPFDDGRKRLRTTFRAAKHPPVTLPPRVH